MQQPTGYKMASVVWDFFPDFQRKMIDFAFATSYLGLIFQTVFIYFFLKVLRAVEDAADKTQCIAILLFV